MILDEGCAMPLLTCIDVTLGLALQLVVRPREIPGYNGDLLPVEKGCESWRRRDVQDPVVQTDSGI